MVDDLVHDGSYSTVSIIPVNNGLEWLWLIMMVYIIMIHDVWVCIIMVDGFIPW